LGRALFAACAAFAIGAIYADTLSAPFVFDDRGAILDNLSLHTLGEALSPPLDTPVTGRPLVNLSFAFNYAFAGLTPTPYRLVNLLLHVLNALLAYGVLDKLFRRPVLPLAVRRRAALCAGAASLLWACHPLQTEAVVYVTQRTELLASCFMLLALHGALRVMESEQPRRVTLLLTAAAVMLGTACKETVVAVPVLMLAFDRGFYADSWHALFQRRRALYLTVALALSPLALSLATSARSNSAGFGLGISAWQALATSGHAIVWYLRLALWPVPLSVSYNWPIADAISRYWLDDLLIAALCVLSIALARTRAWLAVPSLWFFASLAPSSSIVPILSEVAAERRMYLALLALSSALVVGSVIALDRVRLNARVWLLAPCALLVGAYGLRAHARAQDYRSERALFGAALRVAPDNPQAMWGLAGALATQHEYERAIVLYERMASARYPYIGPASWGTRGLLAESRLYASLGDSAHAAQALSRALTHDPNSAVCTLQRAASFVQRGQDAAALSVLTGMLEQPYLLDRVHRELGILYMRRGDTAQAALHLTAAERLQR
jgi:tetratricopeptide (TPR) repeat protein